MGYSSTIKYITFAFSAIILLISTVTGNSINDNLFRWLSGATSAVYILFVIYEKWIWKWSLFKIISRINNHPIIHGTWKGKLKYDKDSNGNPGEIDFYLAIDQTLLTVTVETFVETSGAISLNASIESDKKGKNRLVYTYRSSAPIGQREQNRPHEGTAILNLIGNPVKTIEGGYFTERGGTGRLELMEFCEVRAETFNQAVNLTFNPLT